MDPDLFCPPPPINKLYPSLTLCVDINAEVPSVFIVMLLAVAAPQLGVVKLGDVVNATVVPLPDVP